MSVRWPEAFALTWSLSPSNLPLVQGKVRCCSSVFLQKMIEQRCILYNHSKNILESFFLFLIVVTYFLVASV